MCDFHPDFRGFYLGFPDSSPAWHWRTWGAWREGSKHGDRWIKKWRKQRPKVKGQKHENSKDPWNSLSFLSKAVSSARFWMVAAGGKVDFLFRQTNLDRMQQTYMYVKVCSMWYVQKYIYLIKYVRCLVLQPGWIQVNWNGTSRRSWGAWSICLLQHVTSCDSIFKSKLSKVDIYIYI